MATTPEGKIKAKVNRRLAPLIEARQVHKLMPVQTGYGAVGLDYHLCCGGSYICIETKASPLHLVTKRQLDTMNHIISAGGLCFVIYDDGTLNVAMNAINNAIALYALKQKFAA